MKKLVQFKILVVCNIFMQAMFLYWNSVIVGLVGITLMSLGVLKFSSNKIHQVYFNIKVISAMYIVVFIANRFIINSYSLDSYLIVYYLWHIIINVLLLYLYGEKIPRNNEYRKTLKIIVFCYSLLLISLLFFSFRINSFKQCLNLELFSTIKFYLCSSSKLPYVVIIKNILGNVVLFIPMGYFLREFFSKKLSFLLVWMIPIGIETLQYYSMTGISDVDDVLLNAIGGGIGVYLYKMVSDNIIQKIKQE